MRGARFGVTPQVYIDRDRTILPCTSHMSMSRGIGALAAPGLTRSRAYSSAQHTGSRRLMAYSDSGVFSKVPWDSLCERRSRRTILLRNAGDLKPLALSEHARHFIYRGLLQLQPRLGLSTFAIVINKAGLVGNADPLEIAWTFLLQRLERLSTISGTEVLLCHDEGEPEVIRKLARKARRFGMAGSMFGGHLSVPFNGLLDDPVSRNSRQSLFLQLADLNAYAAFRRTYPPPTRTVPIVPLLLWHELTTARYAAANRRAGGPSLGIVHWPR